MHLAVLLYGFTGILGREISLSGVPLVWYRMWLTFVSLCFFPGLIRAVLRMTFQQVWPFAGIGILMAIHWITFFESIKLSNVTVALSALSTTAFFTSLIEPMVFRKRIRWYELLMGLMVVGGLVLIFRFGGVMMTTGILVGLFSALVVAGASVWNKAVVTKSTSVFPIAMVQFGAGAVFITLLLPFFHWSGYSEASWIPSSYDFALLLVLALVCTTFAYTLNMSALRHLSAFASNLLINLEPIYAIILAALLYREYKELHPGFYLGSLLIIAAVFTYPLLLRWERKRLRSRKEGVE